MPLVYNQAIPDSNPNLMHFQCKVSVPSKPSTIFKMAWAADRQVGTNSSGKLTLVDSRTVKSIIFSDGSQMDRNRNLLTL